MNVFYIQCYTNQGANVKIINNKGQTPLSIAITHLKRETCLQIALAENSGDFLVYTCMIWFRTYRDIYVTLQSIHIIVYRMFINEHSFTT